jgi:hypothetical protein
MTDIRTCPQFQTRIEPIPLRSTTALLPVRRCLLAERMIGFLRTVPEAAEVIVAVAIDPSQPVPVCIHGPDLDTIEHGKCTSDRCAQRCSPSYRELLSRFQLTDSQEIDCGVATPATDPAQSPGGQRAD